MKTMYIQAHIYESCQAQPGFLYHCQDPGYIHKTKPGFYSQKKEEINMYIS